MIALTFPRRRAPRKSYEVCFGVGLDGYMPKLERPRPMDGAPPRHPLRPLVFRSYAARETVWLQRVSCGNGIIQRIEQGLDALLLRGGA